MHPSCTEIPQQRNILHEFCARVLLHVLFTNQINSPDLRKTPRHSSRVMSNVIGHILAARRQVLDDQGGDSEAAVIFWGSRPSENLHLLRDSMLKKIVR